MAAIFLMLAALAQAANATATGASSAMTARNATAQSAAVWRQVSAARYARGDFAGALAAANHLGRPRLRFVTASGLARWDPDAILGAAGLHPGQLLTADAFIRARRRIAEMPALGRVAVDYSPAAAPDEADVHVTTQERAVLPAGAIGWGAVGIQSVFARELHLDVVGAGGLGEIVSPAYRWAANRPGASTSMQLPLGSLGEFGIDASWERASYAPVPPLTDNVVEERTRAGAWLSNWATSWLRWRAGAGFDRLNGFDYATVDGGVQVRLAHDRVAAIASVSVWMAPRTSASSARLNAGPFRTGGGAVMWRSAGDGSRRTVTVISGVSAASAQAPLTLWPVAGSSSVRGELLRAHTLFRNGVITDPVFGRRLAFGNVEYETAVLKRPEGTLTAAVFLDAARAAARRGGAPPSDLECDLGVGVRVRVPGIPGRVRLDAAIGLRDGAHKLSAGYAVPWGRVSFPQIPAR